MPRLSTRDFDYIEARLLTQAPALQEAQERLEAIGKDDLAGRLLGVIIQLADECRAIRHDLGPRP